MKGNSTLNGRKGRKDDALDTLMNDVNQTTPKILVDHQSYDLDIDHMMSGHTLRGQIFPGSLLTDRIYENDWRHLQKEQMHSIVTS
ncbi:hypothetical protein ACQCVP_13320 [Rossellomorea vietnamensis]|uniref:hypothetical protein n=1 Tax=Rossellomorea vietnamensis TaxID=218284 RepID=UPI003CF0DD19